MRSTRVNMGRSRIRKLLSFIWHPVALILINSLLAFLKLAKAIRPITFMMVSEYRIGGFGPRLDFYLRNRRNDPELFKDGIFLSMTGKPANEQLIKMFKRHMPIFKNMLWFRLLNHNMSPGKPFTNTLKGSQFVWRPPLPNWDHHDLTMSEPVLSFTDKEVAKGEQLLKSMGIPDGAWFVCFHAREDAYFATVSPDRDVSANDQRNCSISNYVDAMKYVASCGGYALRMGSVVSDALDGVNDPHIIDYASKYWADDADIYLLGHCKFFVGCDSGLTTIPMLFNVPVIDANSLFMPTRAPSEPVYVNPLNRLDLFLPRPILSNREERLLTFKEILEPPVRYFDDINEYIQSDLEVLENSAQDILDVTREMNDRLDNGWSYSEADEDLQRRFRSLIKPSPPNMETFARVGTGFLRSHEDLLS